MKKRQFIAGALALSLVLAGTGYAYWTDALHVTTKATTADMDVRFLDAGLLAQYNDEAASNSTIASDWSIVDGVRASKELTKDGYVDGSYFTRGSGAYNLDAAVNSKEKYYADRKGYNNVTFGTEIQTKAGVKSTATLPVTIDGYQKDKVIADKNLQISIENMYPGYAQAFRSDIANVGTVAARLSNITASIVSDADNNQGNLADMIGIAVYMTREAYNGVNQSDIGTGSVFGLSKLIKDPANYFMVSGVKFIRLSAFSKITDNRIAASLEKNQLLCQPSDNRMDIFIGVAMDPDATGQFTTGSTKVNADKDDQLSMCKNITVKLDLQWDQFNEGKNVDATNILSHAN